MGIKLAIGVPFSGRFVPPEWAVALANLQFPMNCTYTRLSIKGVPRDQARNRIAQEAVQVGAEYLLFLDDDTAPPADALLRLMPVMDMDPTVAACGGIYTTKGTAINEPLVFLEQGMGAHWRWHYGEVFPCWAIATGCLLIRTAVFQKLSAPWFRDISSPMDVDDPTLMGEERHLGRQIGFAMTDDVYFCEQAHRAGYRIMAHGGVLPVHYTPDGAPHVLPYDSFPLQRVNPSDLWYAPLAPPTRFPEMPSDGAHPAGWLATEEATYLQAAARDKRVLEFGAYKGRSTVYLAEVAREVVSVDHHRGDGHVGHQDTLGPYLRAVDTFPNVVPILATTQAVGALFAPGSFDLVFVDAAHDAASVTRDVQMATRLGQTVLVHDWGLFEVTEGVRAAGYDAAEQVGSLVRIAPRAVEAVA